MEMDPFWMYILNMLIGKFVPNERAWGDGGGGEEKLLERTQSQKETHRHLANTG